MTTQIRQRLQPLRDALLALHKTLVDSERVNYEETFGAIHSPNQFLQLLTSDPWFAWLHALSELVVAMDEALDSKEPATAADVEALFKQTRSLLVATEEGEGFSKHYYDSLQRDPDVVMAHSEVVKALAGKRKV
jgi:hypothetical protein